MEQVLKKRMNRKKYKCEDTNYFTQQIKENGKVGGFTRESMELFESMKEGQQQQENVEFQFATQFDDLKEMSTMVALTAGATAVDVGISKLDCASEITRSMTSQQRMKQPQLRLQLFSKMQQGKMKKSMGQKRFT